MPSSDEFLPFSRPSITDREKQAVLEVLESGWLTTGPKAREFEERFAAFVGSGHAVAVNSATAALHLALEALSVRAGDEVVIPTWTFASTASVAVWQGARPVLVDVDGPSLNATPDALLSAITRRTKAIIAVHLGGLPMDIRALVAGATDRGVPVIEDSAHAFPSRLGGPAGRYAGTIGAAGAFSFYATKTITTGEGGMLVTDDSAIAERARLMSLHGMSRSAWNRYTSTGSWHYDIEEAGFKYNLTDVAAAIGLVQLSRAEELLEVRRRLAQHYSSLFAASRAADLVELPRDPADGSHAWHLYIVRLATDRLSIGRAEVIEALREWGIGASVHFIPLHLHPFYRRVLGSSAQPDRFPIVTREYERVISLPLWPGMEPTDQERVVEALGTILERQRR